MCVTHFGVFHFRCPAGHDFDVEWDDAVFMINPLDVYERRFGVDFRDLEELPESECTTIHLPIAENLWSTYIPNRKEKRRRKIIAKQLKEDAFRNARGNNEQYNTI